LFWKQKVILIYTERGKEKKKRNNGFYLTIILE
jgi:hypothetical protein